MFKRLSIGLLVILALLLYSRYNNKPPRHQKVRQAMAASVTNLIANALPIPEGRPTIAVAQLEGDFQGTVSEQLYSAVEAKDVVVTALVPGGSLLPTALLPSHGRATERVVELANMVGADFVVGGRVVSWRVDTGRRLEINVYFVDVYKQAVIYRNSFVVELDANDATVGK